MKTFGSFVANRAKTLRDNPEAGLGEPLELLTMMVIFMIVIAASLGIANYGHTGSVSSDAAAAAGLAAAANAGTESIVANGAVSAESNSARLPCTGGIKGGVAGLTTSQQWDEGLQIGDPNAGGETYIQDTCNLNNQIDELMPGGGVTMSSHGVMVSPVNPYQQGAN